MLKRIAAVVLGALIAGIVVRIVEIIGSLLYPLPEGATMDGTTMAAVPLGSAVFVLVAWSLGTLAGGVVASRLAPSAPMIHALAVGLIALGVGLLMLITIPSPVWFWICGVAVFPPSAWLGGYLGGRTRKMLERECLEKPSSPPSC